MHLGNFIHGNWGTELLVEREKLCCVGNRIFQFSQLSRKHWKAN